jgi:hypothetical protein
MIKKNPILILLLILITGNKLFSQFVEIKQNTQISIKKSVPKKTNSQSNSLKDSDGDGISDNIDKCPNVKGTLKNEGCPNTGDNNLSKGKSSIARVIKYPIYNYRNTNNLAIHSIEVNDKYTVIEMEYSCSYRYKSNGYFNFNAESILATETKDYKLLYAENIELSPKMTYCSSPGSLYKFKLYYERIDDTVKSFNLIECPFNPECFYFMGINLTIVKEDFNDNTLFYATKLKSDKFQLNLDPITSDILHHQKFVTYSIDFNDYFNEVKNKFDNNVKIDKIESIIKKKRDDNTNVLFTYSDDSYIKGVEFHFSNDKEYSHILKRIFVYFTNQYDAGEFFKSFGNYYGFSYEYEADKKEGMKFFKDIKGNLLQYWIYEEQKKGYYIFSIATYEEDQKKK